MSSNYSLEQYQKYLITWIRKKVIDLNKNGVVFGLSSGKDSSLVAFLAQKAFPKTTFGVYLNIQNEKTLFQKVKEVADFTKIKLLSFDLTNEFESLVNKLQLKNNWSHYNLKPRLRMASIYAIAQEKDLLVLGTSNLAEITLGYYTKYGDVACDLAPIVFLLKKDVTNLLKINNFPSWVYDQTPSADLWKGQTDENEMGVSYHEIDQYCSNKPISKKSLSIIKNLIKRNNHKWLPIPKPNKMF